MAAILASSFLTSSAASQQGAFLATKPAGLAVGDLLLAGVVMYPGSQPVGIVSGPDATWLTAFTVTLANTGSLTWLYKIATATEVAAANFSFTKSGTNFFVVWRVACARYTGFNTTTPVSAGAGDTASAGTTIPVASIAILQSGLLNFLGFQSGNPIAPALTVAGMTQVDTDITAGVNYRTTSFKEVIASNVATGARTLTSTLANGGAGPFMFASMIVVNDATVVGDADRRAGAEIVTLNVSSADPAIASGRVKVYQKLTAGVNQLFARTSDGTIVQLTPTVTLDTAYDGGGSGAGRAVTVDSGAITLTGNAANNNNVLELTKAPAGAQSGDALNLTMGANATGAAVRGTLNGVNNQLLFCSTATVLTTPMIDLQYTGASGTGSLLRLTSAASAAMSISQTSVAGATALNISLAGTSARGIAISSTGANGQNVFTIDAANGGAGVLLTITKNPAIAAAGNGIKINWGTGGGTVSGNAMDITSSNASGNVLNIAQGGTGIGINLGINTSTTNQAIVVTDTVVTGTSNMVTINAAATRTGNAFVTQRGGTTLFALDQNITAAETAMLLSVAGAAVQRVSVGIANSGGVGFRSVLLPN